MREREGKRMKGEGGEGDTGVEIEGVSGEK